MSQPAKAPPVTVEIVVDSVAGARAAEAAGADRLELCCGLAEGGLTPSPGLVRAVKAVVRLPVMAMLRPRGGDFCYDNDEFAVMLADAELLLQNGADGLVFGVLTPAGAIDRPRMHKLVRSSQRRAITCHRAFDLAADAKAALDSLIELGMHRVLTSGQQRSASAGADCIAALQVQAAGRIAVMAGGGLRAANIAAFVARTGVAEVHLSASLWQPSAMRHRNPQVPMGIDLPKDEYMVRTTDVAEIRRVVAALQAR